MNKPFLGAAAAAGLLLAQAGTAQLAQPEVTIATEKVAGGIYVLAGRGGNIGVSVGDDGVFVIDDQYAPLTPGILAALAELHPGPVRFVLNTHWHPDHTGGNENLGSTGAVIVAHDNVRARLGVAQFIEFYELAVPAAAPQAQPVVTFTDSVGFHLNGEDIRVLHVARAHTDGDSIVHFRKSNVIHAGDTYWSRGYPFIDYSSGGSIKGVLAAVDTMLSLSDEQTRVIPGHGPVATRADLVAYRQMLVDTSSRVREMKVSGKTVDEAVAAVPNADYDTTWGKSFVSAERYVRMIYALLERESER